MSKIKINHTGVVSSQNENRVFGNYKTLRTQLICALLLLGTTQSCKKSANDAAPVFQLLRKDATGLDFENALHQTSEFNVFNYMYFFNGGGVAAGDFNNDGKMDLYFTANMGPNKMFLNEGNLKFKDVTEQANVAGTVGAGKPA